MVVAGQRLERAGGAGLVARLASASAAIRACGLPSPVAIGTSAAAFCTPPGPRRRRLPRARARAPAAPGSCRGCAVGQRAQPVERHRRARSPRASASARRSRPKRSSRKTSKVFCRSSMLTPTAPSVMACSVSRSSAKTRTSSRSAGFREARDDVLDQQRRLVVGERDRLGVAEAAELRSRSFITWPRSIAPAKVTSISRPHSGRARRLLPHRDAFGQPARHALVRQLQRDHVRELVPQRRAPVELAGRARLGRVERDDAAEAGAERADHAGQAERAHREVVVPREHLDQDRPVRREVPALGERGQRLARQRRHVFAHHRRFVRDAAGSPCRLRESSRSRRGCRAGRAGCR